MSGGDLLPELDFENFLSSPPALPANLVHQRPEQVQPAAPVRKTHTYQQAPINPRSLLTGESGLQRQTWRKQLQLSYRSQFLDLQRQLESQKNRFGTLPYREPLLSLAHRIEALEHSRQDFTALAAQMRDLRDLITREIQPWVQAINPWLQSLKAQVVDIMTYINEDVGVGAHLDAPLPDLEPFPQ